MARNVIEKRITFVHVDGRWDIRLWGDDTILEPPYYVLRIPLPPELVPPVVEGPGFATSIQLQANI